MDINGGSKIRHVKIKASLCGSIFGTPKNVHQIHGCLGGGLAAEGQIFEREIGRGKKKKENLWWTECGVLKEELVSFKHVARILCNRRTNIRKLNYTKVLQNERTPLGFASRLRLGGRTIRLPRFKALGGHFSNPSGLNILKGKFWPQTHANNLTVTNKTAKKLFSQRELSFMSDWWGFNTVSISDKVLFCLYPLQFLFCNRIAV